MKLVPMFAACSKRSAAGPFGISTPKTVLPDGSPEYFWTELLFVNTSSEITRGFLSSLILGYWLLILTLPTCILKLWPNASPESVPALILAETGELSVKSNSQLLHSIRIIGFIPD